MNYWHNTNHFAGEIFIIEPIRRKRISTNESVAVAEDILNSIRRFGVYTTLENMRYCITGAINLREWDRHDVELLSEDIKELFRYYWWPWSKVSKNLKRIL